MLLGLIWESITPLCKDYNLGLFLTKFNVKFITDIPVTKAY